ncbi:MAG: SEC-C domain-containing protein [Planctomycetes bacterium]|nr:SEC-C domain-containing protein [Planctomycetota bacterium]
MDPYLPCPCGSGKKFKFCCREKVREQERVERAEREAAQSSLALSDDELDRLEDEEERGLALLDAGSVDEAAACFEALLAAHPELPGPHVHLAEARLGEGRLAEVEPLLQKHLRIVGGEDPLALGMLVRVALLSGRRDEALQHAERLWRLRAIDEEALWQKVYSCAFFRREEELLRWVERWSYPDHPLAADLAFFAGVAAANLGRTELALTHFEEALSSERYGDLADAHHERLESGRGPGSSSGRWSYFRSDDLLPSVLLDRWIEKVEVPSAGLRDLVIEWLDDASATDADGIALLGAIGDEVSVEALRAYARGQSGSFGSRLRAVSALHRAGALAYTEPIEVWTGASWCAVPVPLGEVVPQDVFEAIAEHLERLERHGSSLDERREYLLAAVAEDPEDWFARISLARMELLERGPAAARAHLEERVLPQRALAGLLFYYALTRLEIHLQEADLEAVAPWLLLCARVLPGWERVTLERAEVEALFDSEAPFDRAAWDRSQRQRGDHVLAPELLDLLYRRSWAGVRDFATAHRLLAPLELTRSALIERLHGSLRERGFAPLLEELSPIARETLATLRSRGGAMPLELLEIRCQSLFMEAGREEAEALYEALDLLDLLDERALIAIGPPAEGVQVPGVGGGEAAPGELCVFLTREVGELLDAAPRA